jgi:hypothetical protein
MPNCGTTGQAASPGRAASSAKSASRSPDSRASAERHADPSRGRRCPSPGRKAHARFGQRDHLRRCGAQRHVIGEPFVHPARHAHDADRAHTVGHHQMRDFMDQVIAQRARRRHGNCRPSQPVGRQIGMAQEHVPGRQSPGRSGPTRRGFRRKEPAPASPRPPARHRPHAREDPAERRRRPPSPPRASDDGFGRQGRVA